MSNCHFINCSLLIKEKAPASCEVGAFSSCYFTGLKPLPLLYLKGLGALVVLVLVKLLGFKSITGRSFSRRNWALLVLPLPASEV